MTNKVTITVSYIILWGAIVLFMFPIIFMGITSFKYERDIMTDRIILIPSPGTLRNYQEIITGNVKGGGTVGGKEGEAGYKGSISSRAGKTGMIGMKNSLIISIFTTMLSLVVGTPAAYALARFNVKNKHKLANWILSTRMFPPAAIVLPLFMLWQTLRLVDTYIALIISYMVFNLPFVIWLMRGFFMDIPKEVEESALIDGCGVFKSLIKISVPLSVPGIAATAVFCYIFSWNEFLFALILTRIRAQTYPVQLAGYIGTSGILWGQMSAMSMIALIPVVVLLILTQRYMVRGLSFGSIR
jgi:multiple sugar transport system permease protein